MRSWHDRKNTKHVNGRSFLARNKVAYVRLALTGVAKAWILNISESCVVSLTTLHPPVARLELHSP